MNPQLPMRAIALSLLFASGCQAPVPLHQLKQPWFALGQADPAVPTMVVGRPATASGQLTIRFDGALAQLSQGRRIQATVADVEQVVVTITPASGAAVSQTVLKAQLNSGQTSVTFNGLPPGGATVTITALDAAGVNIGTTTQTATVTAGQVATLDIALQLAPSYVGGGGTGSSSTGGLTANVMLQDGAIVQSLPGGGVVETLVLPFTLLEIGSNGRDSIWVTGYQGQTPFLAKISTTGAIERLITSDWNFGSVCVDAEGDAWVIAGNQTGGISLLEYAADGTLLSRRDRPDSGLFFSDHMRMDGSGNVYAFGGPMGGGERWAPDGTTVWFPTQGSTVTPGTLDDVWIGVLPSESGGFGDVARFSKAGVELGRYSVGDGFRSAYTAIDQEGNAWVSAMWSDWGSGGPRPKGRLVKFTAEGDLLGTFELSNGTMPQDVEIGSDGRVWVVSGGSGPGTVTWFDADGVELGHYAMDKVFPYRFAATSNGAWVISDHQKGVIVHVAP